MECLKERGNQAEGCRSLAKLYLECRMERCGCQVLHQFLLQECHTRPLQHLAPDSTSVCACSRIPGNTAIRKGLKNRVGIGETYLRPQQPFRIY